MDITIMDLLTLATEPCEKRGALLTGKEEVTLDCPIHLTNDQINRLIDNNSDVYYNEQNNQIIIHYQDRYVTPSKVILQLQ